MNCQETVNQAFKGVMLTQFYCTILVFFLILVLKFKVYDISTAVDPSSWHLNYRTRHLDQRDKKWPVMLEGIVAYPSLKHLKVATILFP